MKSDNDALIEHMTQMLLTIKTEQLYMLNEVRTLLREVQAERRQLFEIVIKNGDLPTLHAVADLFEQRKSLH